MKIGFCLGRLELIHNGYIDLFRKAKENCDFLIVGVISDSFKGLQKKKLFLPYLKEKRLLKP